MVHADRRVLTRGNSMYFGLGLYYPREFSHDGESLSRALLHFARYSLPDPVRFQGMYAKSDRHSPARELNEQRAGELAANFDSGVYSDASAFAGTRQEPTAQMSLAVIPRSDAAYRFGFFHAKIRSGSEVGAAVEYAKELYGILRASY